MRTAHPAPAPGNEPASLGRRITAAGLDYMVILLWVAVVTALGLVARAIAPGLTQVVFAEVIATASRIHCGMPCTPTTQPPGRPSDREQPNVTRPRR